MSLLSLPNETVSTVFEFVTSATDLAAAVRVCHRLHGVGERALYTNIVIVDPIDNQSSSVVIPHKTVCCCTTILRKDYLASFIKKFHLRWTKDQVRIAEGRIPQPVVERLSRVLQRSNHIESLELHLAGFSGFYQEILDQCFFQLRYFSLSGSTNKPIEWFLHSQPTLVHLHLGDQHLPLTLLTEDLPVLEWFRGDPITAASILPFRPVTGLSLIGREPTEDCLRAFSDSTIPIRALDLGGLSITPMQLVMISKHLSALESLRMRLALRHTLHFTFSGMVRWFNICIILLVDSQL